MPRREFSLAGLKLRCRAGHWEFASFELSTLPTTQPPSYGMVARCDFGDHWLAERDPDDQLWHPRQIVVRDTPYGWPTAADAFAALARYEAQDQQREETTR